MHAFRPGGQQILSRAVTRVPAVPTSCLLSVQSTAAYCCVDRQLQGPPGSTQPGTCVSCTLRCLAPPTCCCAGPQVVECLTSRTPSHSEHPHATLCWRRVASPLGWAASSERLGASCPCPSPLRGRPSARPSRKQRKHSRSAPACWSGTQTLGGDMPPEPTRGCNATQHATGLTRGLPGPEARRTEM